MRDTIDTENSQLELLKEAQQGDRTAFETLLGQSREELEKFVTTRIGDHLRSRVETDDVLQDTCARAWASIGEVRWTGPDTFVRWLKGIARHVILQQADRARHDELIYLQEVRATGDDVSPSRSLRREERFDRLQASLDSLSPDYREAVMLVRIEGLQIKEAARRMKRTPKAVTHLLARALKTLKDSLGDTESLHLPDELLKRREDDEP